MKSKYLHILILFLILIMFSCSLESSDPSDTNNTTPEDSTGNGYKVSSPVPADGSIVQTRNVQLHWTADGNPVFYKVIFDTHPAPNNVLMYFAESNLINKSRLREGRRYYWQITANYADGSISESPVWNFVVDNIYPPGYTLVKHDSETHSPSNVSMLFQVLDLDDVGVASFTINSFVLYEDGETIHNLESLVQVRRPSSVPYSQKTIVMIDNSSSVDSTELATLKNAAYEFIHYGLETNQTVELYEFSESITQLSPATSDRNVLENLIKGITQGSPSTNLYGAVIEGVDKWRDEFNSSTADEGLLIVFTDGNDTQGSKTLNEAVAAVNGKKVIMVSYDYTNDIDLNILKQLSTVDFFYTTEMQFLKDYLSEEHDRLYAYSNSFYLLDYRSPTRGDAMHRLEVRVKDNPYEGTGSFINADYNSKDFN